MISILDQEFSALNQYIAEQNPSQIFILVDENTHENCLPTLLANLETEIPFEIIEIEAGEDAKTIATATQLWEILAEFKADRKSLLLNLGGGVITDMVYSYVSKSIASVICLCPIIIHAKPLD